MNATLKAIRRWKWTLLGAVMVALAICVGLLAWALIEERGQIQIVQDIRIDGIRPAHHWDAANSGQTVTWSDSLAVQVSATYEENSTTGEFSGPVSSFLVVDVSVRKVGEYPSEWAASELLATIRTGDEYDHHSISVPNSEERETVQIVSLVADWIEVVEVEISTGFVVDEAEARLRWVIPGPGKIDSPATPLPEGAMLTVKLRDVEGLPLAGGCVRAVNAVISIERCDNADEDPDPEIGQIGFMLPQGFAYRVEEVRAPDGYALVQAPGVIGRLASSGGEVIFLHTLPESTRYSVAGIGDDA